MSGCKYPCEHCGELVSTDDNVCLYCGKVTPVGTRLCPLTKKPLGTLHDGAGCGYCSRLKV